MSAVPTAVPGWGYAQNETKRKRRCVREGASRAPQRLAPDEEWMTKEEAAECLEVSMHCLDQMRYRVRGAVRGKSRSVKEGRSTRGIGVLLYRPDVARLAVLRREASLGLEAAFRVLLAMKEGRI